MEIRGPVITSFLTTLEGKNVKVPILSDSSQNFFAPIKGFRQGEAVDFNPLLFRREKVRRSAAHKESVPPSFVLCIQEGKVFSGQGEDPILRSP